MTIENGNMWMCTCNWLHSDVWILSTQSSFNAMAPGKDLSTKIGNGTVQPEKRERFALFRIIEVLCMLYTLLKSAVWILKSAEIFGRFSKHILTVIWHANSNRPRLLKENLLAIRINWMSHSIEGIQWRYVISLSYVCARACTHTHTLSRWEFDFANKLIKKSKSRANK